MNKITLAKYYGLDPSNFNRALAKGVPYKEIYCILENKKLTRGEKKKQIYSLPIVSESIVDNIWTKYVS